MKRILMVLILCVTFIASCHTETEAEKLVSEVTNSTKQKEVIDGSKELDNGITLTQNLLNDQKEKLNRYTRVYEYAILNFSPADDSYASINQDFLNEILIGYTENGYKIIDKQYIRCEGDILNDKTTISLLYIFKRTNDVLTPDFNLPEGEIDVDLPIVGILIPEELSNY